MCESGSRDRRTSVWTRVVAVSLAAVMVLAIVGCVERTISITTTPEGAMVYLNDEEVGRTPVSKNFTWYGDYDVTIRKEGYKPLKTHTKVIEPWYQIPPIDFFAECLFPATIRDHRHFDYALEPVEPTTNPAEIVERAQQFKDHTLYGEQ